MNYTRALVTGTGRWFMQVDTEDVHTQFGRVRADVLASAADGDVVESDAGEKFIVYSPTFLDRYKKIKRGAQIITFKDAGVILTTAGLGPDSIVCEAGSGSGALTVLLSRHCKQVFSYDIEEEHLAIAKENVAQLGLDNVTFRKHDIAAGIPDTELDALILDMPQPWLAFPHISSAMKIGGVVVTYVPSTMQLKQVHEMASQVGLMHLRSVEVTERHWMVKGEAVRPTSRNVAFTAFLSFFRWLGPRWGELRPKEAQPTPGWTLPDEEFMQELFSQPEQDQDQ